MRIVERYEAGFKLWRGAGGWALFYPLRLVLSWIYRLWLFTSGGRAAPGARTLRINQASARGPGPCIISIGNLEAGGGGKTPCTLRLAEEILARGGVPVVVSRGYGGAAERYSPCVVAAGRKIEAGAGGAYRTEEEALSMFGAPRGTTATVADCLGDEIILYRTRGIPVVIDADRERGAACARRLFSATHVLLDDAFQNHSIRKDVDIVLLDAARPLGDGRLLPLGVLRESPSAIARADVVIFTRAHEERVPNEAKRFVGGKELFFAEHAPVDLIDRTGRAVPLSFLEHRECILFSGVARPESFEETIVSLGAQARLAFRFIDHHRYRRGDIRRMIREGGSRAPFITTEKDWAKVCDLFPPGAEILALRIEMKIRRIEKLFDILASSSSGCALRSSDTP